MLFSPVPPVCTRHVVREHRPHYGRSTRAYRDRPGARAGRGQPRGQGQGRPTRTGGNIVPIWEAGREGSHDVYGYVVCVFGFVCEVLWMRMSLCAYACVHVCVVVYA